MTTTYKTVTTTKGLELINQHVLNNDEAFIASDWYIALGTGNLTPSKNTTQLVNKIFDKNSTGYQGFVVQNDTTLGRLAKITIPSSLEGNIITEIGLFNEDDELMVCANTYIDLTATSTQGLLNTFTAAISLKAIPDDIDILYVPEGDYVTHETYDPFVTSTLASLLQKANIDLSNLSTVGQAILDGKASVNLSNLSTIGQALLDKKVEVEALLQQNGYAKFTWKENNEISKLVIQWGISNYGTLINLPISYEHGYSAIGLPHQIQETAAVISINLFTKTLSTLKLQVRLGGYGTEICNFDWIAIGS